jgi:hypothetical protein
VIAAKTMAGVGWTADRAVFVLEFVPNRAGRPVPLDIVPLVSKTGAVDERLGPKRTIQENEIRWITTAVGYVVAIYAV